MTLILSIVLGMSSPVLACSQGAASTKLGKSISYRAGGPQVILGKPTIYGSMPKEIVQTLIERQRGSIQACYQKQLTEQAGISGTIRANILVGADGMVKSLRLESSPGISQTLESCLREEMMQLRFPSTCSGIVIIKQPFEFKQKPPNKKPHSHPKPRTDLMVEGPAQLRAEG